MYSPLFFWLVWLSPDRTFMQAEARMHSSSTMCARAFNGVGMKGQNNFEQIF
jgi:hypothetical protein